MDLLVDLVDSVRRHRKDPQRRDKHSAAEPQTNGAERLECGQLAGAVVKREQAPNASRGRSSVGDHQ